MVMYDLKICVRCKKTQSIIEYHLNYFTKIYCDVCKNCQHIETSKFIRDEFNGKVPYKSKSSLFERY